MVTKGENRRLSRVNETVREELARLLVRVVGDPRLSWVTITEVDVSPDLRSARIFFVPTGVDDPEPVLRSLRKAAAFLQGELGRNLKLRYTPRLTFSFDDTFDRAERIDALIGEVASERQKRPAESPVDRLSRHVEECDSILVATHRNPDGDAIGSLLGLTRILLLKGKRPVPYCPDGIPKVLSFLPGADELIGSLDQTRSFDLTICLDTADDGLLPEGFPPPERRGIMIVIDHHALHGDMGDVVIRREASSVGEMLFELARQLVWPIDASVAQCLYTSIVADTGSFRYTSTTSSTHLAAAELIAAGARPWQAATALYESFPLRRQRLLSLVLGTLELSADGRFASMTATPEMFERAGAKKEDLDSMINFGRSVDTVEISAMLRLEPSGDIKVSFRSKGRIDVGELAARFDGGGHRNASGCTLTGMDLDSALNTIRAAAQELLVECERTGRRDTLS